MALLDLWNTDRSQITGKRVDQLIAFAGDGRLLDGNCASQEFRSILRAVPSDLIGRWLDECLDMRFSDFGFVLQDTINEIGGRLGFDVTHGVYRGHSAEGYDGLWRIPGGGAILIEAKSSTAYSISLTRISEYRKQVAPQLGMPPEEISVLIVVGTEDTSEFESQVRGSRFAWDVRLLGVRSLFRLLQMKESLDDPRVERQIQEILVPQEFTRLDTIVDLVFATAEDARDLDDDVPAESLEAIQDTERGPPANFHAAILPRLETHFAHPLVKVSRVQWASVDGTIHLSCQVAKRLEKGLANFWFGLKRSTQESLASHQNSYCAFGLGSPDHVVLMPYGVLARHLDGMFTSPDNREGGIRHWHVRFVDTDDGVSLLVDRDRQPLDVTEFLLK